MTKSIWSSLARASVLRALLLVFVVVVIGLAGQQALAQADGAADGESAAGAVGEGLSSVTLRSLFAQSFDLFTVLIMIGSVVAWTVIIICMLDIREGKILPAESTETIRRLAAGNRWGDLRGFVSRDESYPSRVVRAALAVPGDDKDSVRDAGEVAASEESARWFRKIEPLNVLGNIGPLLGLAGTVWGMIIAFAALESSGGEARPEALAAGIAKALFHTLLGLLLALPCLLVFGFYRSVIDRLCTRAMVVSSALVEMLPGEQRLRQGEPGPGGQQRGAPQQTVGVGPGGNSGVV